MKTDPIAHWLITEAPAARDLRTAVEGLVKIMAEEGFELCRVVINSDMLHPELLAETYSWQKGEKYVKRIAVPHGITETSMFQNSPFQMLNQGTEIIRRRLSGPEAQVDSASVEEIRDIGGTDYFAMSLPRSNGDVNRSSFATDREGGFTDHEIERLTFLRPYLSVMVEIQGRAYMTRTLLDLYLGTKAGLRVYGGEIKRGEGEVIHSVLFISDLRGFMKLSEQLSLEHITAVLNDYFEAMIGPVHAHGGEVLKIIGDGVLASFPIENAGDTDEVCERALGAAELAMANITLLNRRRARENKPALRAGIGLHVGDAIYGNVGAHDRLDFTVIGPAVNLCARLEALEGALGEEIICSAEFASHSADEFRSLGEHQLKNVENEVEAFAPVQ